MSVMAKNIDMQCDDCGNWRTIMASTPAEARRQLRQARWLTRNEGDGLRDYCPDCRYKHRIKRTR
jgi:hypothetical protein